MAASAADNGHMRLVLVLVLLTLLAGPALTASNSVPPAPAGSGTGAVSGYTVSSITYSLGGETVDGISFALSPPGAATVKARLAPDEPWTACAVTGGAVSCPVATSLVDAALLEVVAAG